MIDQNFPNADSALDGVGVLAEAEADSWCPVVGPEGYTLMDICEVRVGGIPWNKVEHSPRQGEWAVEIRETIVGVRLGSPTFGGTIRCDIESSSHDDWRRLNGRII